LDAGETAARIARLRELLARGKTLQQCELKLRSSKSTLNRLAARFELPRRRMSIGAQKDREVARLLARGESERTICRLLEIGKGTVWRRKEARRKRLGQPKTVKPYRCQGPCGRMVIYVPCQICAALASQVVATQVRRQERAKAIAARWQRLAAGPDDGKAGQEPRS
jgi:hypothetical protein